jgi:hypothetical protein
MSGSDSDEGFSFLCGLDDDDFDGIVEDEEPQPKQAEEPPTLPAEPPAATKGPKVADAKEKRVTVSSVRQILARGKSIQLKCDWGVGIGGNIWT